MNRKSVLILSVKNLIPYKNTDIGWTVFQLNQPGNLHNIFSESLVSIHCLTDTGNYISDMKPENSVCRDRKIFE